MPVIATKILTSALADTDPGAGAGTYIILVVMGLLHFWQGKWIESINNVLLFWDWPCRDAGGGE